MLVLTMLNSVLRVVWTTSLLCLSHASTAPLLPQSAFNDTDPRFVLAKTTANNASAPESHADMRIAGGGNVNNDSSPDRSGFTYPEATLTSATFVAQTSVATVIVTLTPSVDNFVTTTRSGVPTEYLSQVPEDWPYTRYGVGRRRETEAWGLTDEEGQTVAVVKHELKWFPRPMWTGSGQMLDGWRPTFVVTQGDASATSTAAATPTRAWKILLESSQASNENDE